LNFNHFKCLLLIFDILFLFGKNLAIDSKLLIVKM
jgi:hypothetical protein